MQSFDDLEIVEQEVPVYDKYALQKQRLLMNVTRSDKVISAISTWLMSFEGGVSKDVFMKQVAKLDFNDELAIEQLTRSKGRRSITKPRVVAPPLPEVGNIIQMLSEGNLYIAVNGGEGALRSYIRDTYQTLKSLGTTYVLDVNDLRLEWAEKSKPGKSGEMLRNSKDAEFLIVEGFQTPIDLPFYIGDAINAVRRYRVERNMPIISTYTRYRDKDRFFQYFKKYHVGRKR